MSMSPDEFVLDAIFQEYARINYPGEATDDVFEKFVITQLTKPRDITPDEIAAGIVDGPGDGGIDSFYVFVNGTLLDVDDPLLATDSPAMRKLAQNPHIEALVVQAKNSTSWKEVVWEHLLTTLPNVLNPAKTDAELEALFNSDVAERTGISRRAILSLAGKFPRVSFRAIYAARAQEQNITTGLTARAEQLRYLLAPALTAEAMISVENLGVSGLYKLAGQTYSEPATLQFRQLIREQDAFLGVVTVRDYLSFVRDSEGTLRDELFDANVRDYEGDNSVNEAIASTLASDGCEFWWLNNGVTVLADRVDSPQQRLTLQRPLVVNGLQTTHVLDRAESQNLISEARLEHGIVVRVVQSTDEEVRDRIIAGTNRQTQVPTPALYATRQEQIDIERFLLAHGIYYERRKNRYRATQPTKLRISMNLLAQAMIATLLSQPDEARARPSTMLGRMSGYEQIFPENLDLNVYLCAIGLLRAVDDYLRTPEAREIMDAFTNVRFYVLMGYVWLETRATNYERVKFEHNFRLLNFPLNMSSLEGALRVVASTFKEYKGVNGQLSSDRIFKSADFRELYVIALSRHNAGS